MHGHELSWHTIVSCFLVFSRVFVLVFFLHLPLGRPAIGGRGKRDLSLLFYFIFFFIFCASPAIFLYYIYVCCMYRARERKRSNDGRAGLWRRRGREPGTVATQMVMDDGDAGDDKRQQRPRRHQSASLLFSLFACSDTLTQQRPADIHLQKYTQAPKGSSSAHKATLYQRSFLFNCNDKYITGEKCFEIESLGSLHSLAPETAKKKMSSLELWILFDCQSLVSRRDESAVRLILKHGMVCL